MKKQYQKNEKLEADSSLKTLLAFVRFALVIIALVGIALSIFQSGSWLMLALSKVLDSTLGLITLPLVLLALYLANNWINNAATNKGSGAANFPFNLLMLIGLFFTLHYLTTGQL